MLPVYWESGLGGSEAGGAGELQLLHQHELGPGPVLHLPGVLHCLPRGPGPGASSLGAGQGEERPAQEARAQAAAAAALRVHTEPAAQPRLQPQRDRLGRPDRGLL